LRRSSALEIIKDLVSHGAKVKAYDPKADMNELREFIEFEFCTDVYKVAADVDALVLITDWSEFKELDYEKLKYIMKKPIFIDTKNLLDAEKMSAIGFSYFGIGRGR
jgi:UDPglucose 6-dehydrogenase